jgi:hypothetical protein
MQQHDALTFNNGTAGKKANMKLSTSQDLIPSHSENIKLAIS